MTVVKSRARNMQVNMMMTTTILVNMMIRGNMSMFMSKMRTSLVNMTLMMGEIRW